MVENVVNFELFKNQKQLDNEYEVFMRYCNKFFGSDVSASGVFKRLYFATRYLEGTVNGYTIFTTLGLSDAEYQKGTELFCDWLEDIVKNLRGE